MPTITPPIVPPPVQESPESRIHFRIYQIGLSILTVAVTCWLWTIHPIVGIAAAFLAKHILVAILAAGLTYPHRDEKM